MVYLRGAHDKHVVKDAYLHQPWQWPLGALPCSVDVPSRLRRDQACCEKDWKRLASELMTAYASQVDRGVGSPHCENGSATMSKSAREDQGTILTGPHGIGDIALVCRGWGVEIRVELLILVGSYRRIISRLTKTSCR